MSPRRQESPVDVTFTILKVTPIGVGPIAAVVGFAFLRWVVPALMPVPKPGGLDGHGRVLLPPHGHIRTPFTVGGNTPRRGAVQSWSAARDGRGQEGT